MAVGTTRVKLLRELAGTELIHADLQGHRFPLHFHDTFVVQLVLSGVDWCADLGIAANAGEIFVHFPFAAHTGGTRDSSRLVYRAIYPELQLFKQLTGVDESSIPSGASVVLSNPLLSRETRELFAVSGSDSQDEARKARSLASVFELAMAIVSEKAELNVSRKVSGNCSKMLAARTFLLENYSREITTRELSDHCDVSRYHLIRSFKRQFGITPRQFLISQRVAQAKRMIASGSSITSAAYATGFSDHSHLTRYFKKITSYPPSQMV